MRKVAAHFVRIEGREELPQAVVEIEGSQVVRCYPLNGEQPMTEWLGGTIVITPRGQALHNGRIIKET